MEGDATLTTDTEDRVPNDVPQESVEEEEDQVHDKHDGQRKRCLIPAKRTAEHLVAAVLNLHSDHHLDGITEG